jgi:hypothetical protein
MLLDLSISGRPVTRRTSSGFDEIPRLLGCILSPKIHGLCVKLTWLETLFATMPTNPTHEQLMQQLRVYLLYFFGKFLFPDTSGDRVHTMYLPLLEDIETIKSYSWGAACLATLYRGLCDVTTSKKDNPTIPRCAILLNAWAHCRIVHAQRERFMDPPHLRPLALSYVYTNYY